MPAKSKTKTANSRRRVQTAPAVNPTALTTPASLGTVVSLSLGAGIDHAFILLGHLPHEKCDPRLDTLCLAYRQASPQERPTEDNLDTWVVERGVATWEFLGWLVMSIGALGGNAAQLIINSAKLPITKASLERSLNDPEEAREWLRSWGYVPVPQKSSIINVDVSATAQSVAAASAQERGLPAFGETLDEAEAVLRDQRPVLPASTAEPIDVPFTITEKEPAHVHAK